MMITNKQKEKLKANWGEKADCMASNAEVRVYDPLSAWTCYIYALSPEDDNTIKCIIVGGKNDEPMDTEWSLYELSMLYNSEGEGVIIDREYRPRQAAELFKLLNEVKNEFS